MAEKFTYGPLVYNYFGEDDDSGNFWWAGNPPVAYEEESGPYRIPIDAEGNQCLPGDCILHPNCQIEKWDEHPQLGKIPSLAWCREWFDDNFLIVSDNNICRYILRWYWWNHQYEDTWKEFSKGKKVPEMIGEIWPDVPKS